MRLPLILAIAAAFSLNAAHAADTDNAGAKDEHHEIKKEASEHPRIAQSIKDLDATIDELKKAPHDFGGHRDAAIKACEDARKELKAALEYRADKDEKHEKK